MRWSRGLFFLLFLLFLLLLEVKGWGEDWGGREREKDPLLPVSVLPTKECLEDKNCAAGTVLSHAIKAWQNPSPAECHNRKFIVWETKAKAGIGAYLATMANGFMEALCNQRVFLLSPLQPWGFPTPEDMMFDSHSLFRPLSSCPIPTNPAPDQVINKSGSWKTICTNTKLRLGEDPFGWLFPENGKNPKTDSLFNYTTDRFHATRMRNFLRAHLLRFILTPNTHNLLHNEMKKFVSSAASFTPSSLTTFLSVHIRLGDKVNERPLPKPFIYLDYAEKLLSERQNNNNDEVIPIFLSTETQQVVQYFRENTPKGSQILAYEYARIGRRSPIIAARMGDLIPSLTNLFTSQWGSMYVLFPDSHWSILIYDMMMTRGDGGGDPRIILLRTNPKLLGEMSMLWPRVPGQEKGKNSEGVKIAHNDCVQRESPSLF